ncbi:transporter substrate-binding domain-containing protein [Ottowia testudinis]|uniref:Transporter substrate-binding domain-containing protein n=1 Tax=Ottowia testudinis TaxID=2816950 RepID=A0A975CFT6_9BURK|nr:transporter substrate-binding domain-containing protein [Ottowia testudinis]QTD45415.1 transporter substrate-binding domain-containing protein [Ottowia testudinis]
MDGNFPPMVFRDGKGNLVGYDIDMSREAFKRMGVTPEYHDLHWGAKDNELLKTKTVDLFWSGMNISPERAAIYEFSVPYLSNRQIVVVPVDSPIRSIADLAGKRVGAQRGSSLLPRLEALQSTGGRIAKLEDFEEYAGILVSMIEGKIDAGVMGSVALDAYQKNTPGKFRVLDENLGETNMAAAFRKEDRATVEKLNRALEAMKADGTAEKIRVQWFDQKA